MREYTETEIEHLKRNKYTYNVTKYKLYFTISFKEKFWELYNSALQPRQILRKLGYDTDMFSQEQIDSIAKSIKTRAKSGRPFFEGENNWNKGVKGPRRKKTPTTFDEMVAEIKYLRCEVEFLKKLRGW